MARKRVYNSNRFDGGMSDSPRDTSNLTKLAYISHLDIYRDPNRMFVMPGFESFSGYDGDPVGIKVYDPQDVAFFDETNVILLAKKSDGTGSKLFQAASTETQWKNPVSYSTNEGADNLIPRPFLAILGGISYYPVNVSSTLRIARIDFSTYSNSWTAASSENATGGNKTNYIQATPANNTYFYTHAGSINRLETSGVTWNFKSSATTVRDLTTSDYTVGITGSVAGPSGRVLIWDDASLLADQRNNLGGGRPRAIGAPSQTFTVIMDEYLVGSGEESTTNGISQMTVRALVGETQDSIYRVRGFRNAANDIYSVKTGYKNMMTWYAYYATNSGGSAFENGVWAFGKGEMDSQMGVSKLIDTSSLGAVRQARWIGDNCWFINHSGDGSVSRLQRFDTGTYDVPATIETLIYGADSPYLKELNGISIVTENLPSGGSVVVSYRTDEDNTWTTMGTSDTAGKQKHNFTKANGTPIGRFQEIQFRIVITGKTAVKNIMVAVTETDDLSF